MSTKWQQPAYLNGEYLRVDDAKVSVLDRGFLFGDGVYELIPSYARRLFRLPQHLQRLARSLSEIGIPNPYGDEHWTAILTGLVSRALNDDLAVYLQVTRGVAPREHVFPEGTPPTVFAMAFALKPPSEETLTRGVSAITVEDLRWRRCDIKSISLLGNVLLRQQARDHGAVEAILIRDGYVTEGAASNVFIVSDGVLITPPKSNDLLAGISRDLVLELAAEHGIRYQETPISETALLAAREVWLTSSTKEILSITRINDTPIGDGQPGPAWSRMYELFQARKTASD